MRKIWLIARTTYRRRIRSGTFLILTFGLPVLMIVAGAIPFILAGGDDLPPVGYVDQTGELADVSQVEVAGDILQLVAYDDAGAARSAVQAGEIEGYLLIPAGYFDGESAQFFGEDAPGALLEEGLRVFMRQAMLPGADDLAIERLNNPADITFTASASGEEVTQGPAMIVRTVLPIGLAVLFGLMVFTSINQMGSAIIQEKDQRSMEMIITSLSSSQLVIGKVLGLTLISLTQIAIWGVSAAIALTLALSGTLSFSDIVVPWNAVLWIVLLGLPAYFLYAVLAAGLGIIAGDRSQAQQLAGMLGLVALFPFYFVAAIIGSPGGTLAVSLTLFPLTSPMFALIRMIMTEVPLWQLVAALALVVVSLAAAVWAVTRIFRAAMLLYGQALSPRQIWQALRQA